MCKEIQSRRVAAAYLYFIYTYCSWKELKKINIPIKITSRALLCCCICSYDVRVGSMYGTRRVIPAILVKSKGTPSWNCWLVFIVPTRYYVVLSPDVSSIFIIIDKYVCTWCTRTYVVWCTQFEIIMMVYWFKIIWHFPSIWFPNLGGLKIGMICHSLQQNEIKNWIESFQRISNLSWKISFTLIKVFYNLQQETFQSRYSKQFTKG